MTVITIHKRNPSLAADIKVVTSRRNQLAIAWGGILFLSGFLVIHIWKDVVADVDKWYFHSTPVWLLVMALATIIFFVKFNRLKNSGIDVDKLFSMLPPE
ncbi:MAG: hypothetical protein JJE09_11790 [Bacteroidia bacterium]|nr:hypothetical protein [Bacteroidia bacterium]